MSAGDAPRPLDEVLAEVAAAIRTGEARCIEVVPRSDGTLWMRWSTSSIVLVRPRSGQEQGDAFTFEPLDAATWTADMQRSALEAFRAHWAGGLGVWVSPGVSLRRRMRVTRDLRSVIRVLGSKFAPGVVFWRGWSLHRVCSEANGQHDGVQMTFGNGEAQRRFLLRRQPGAGAPWHGWSFETHEAGQGSDELYEAIGFLLSRCLVGSLDWVDATDADGDREQEGLISNCSRGSFEYNQQPSAFFSPWGYPDTFGTAGVVHRMKIGVFHASRECPMANQGLHRALFNGVRPWTEELGEFLDPAARLFVTDTDDASIVTGGEERLGKVFAQIKAQASADDDIMVCQGCDYHLIGDSPEAVGRSCFRQSQVALTFLQPRMPNFEEGDTRNSSARFLDRVVAQRQAPAPRTINLVGFGSPQQPAVRELCAMLSDQGISMAAVVMPGLPPGAETAFGKAGLTIASPWQPVHDVFTEPMLRRKLPVIELGMPYGVGGTLRWLDRVRSALGMEPLDEAMREKLSRLAEADDVDASNGPVRVGLVYDLGLLSEVLSPEFFFGADAIELFCGPRVELTVVHVPAPGRHRAPERACIERLVKSGASFAEYEPGTPIEDVVREHGLHAVYCDVLRPLAVKRAGAAPLHIRDFELGLQGRARTVRRLAALRGFSLYRSLGGYLG